MFFVARWKWSLFLLFFPLSLFSFIVFLPHRFLLPLAVLLLLSSFLLLESLLPLTVLFLSFFAAAGAAVFVFFIKAYHTEWHVIVNVSKFESDSSSSFRIFVFTQFCFIVTAFTSRAKWKVAVCVFEPCVCRRLHFYFCRFFGFLVSQCWCDNSQSSLHPCVFFVWTQRNEGCQCGWQCGWIRQHEFWKQKQEQNSLRVKR